MINATTTIKYAKVAPLKAARIGSAIRNKKVSQALWIIKASNLRCGEYFNHAISNATAILKDKGSVASDPIIAEVRIDKGPVFKRFRSGSRGYGNKYVHKTSNIILTLSDEPRKIDKTVKTIEKDKSSNKKKDTQNGTKN
jgi:large subunit ribosomal protein L22